MNLDALPKTIVEAKAVGSRYYYPARPCRFGNLDARLTSAGICRCAQCKELFSKRAGDAQKRDPARRRAAASEWRSKNVEWVRAYRREYKDKCFQQDRERHLQRSYGLAPGQYDALLERQNHRCALCGKVHEDAPRKRLCVDHCHKTGRVRGLLCQPCNKALGVVEKYREAIAPMLDYADNASVAECDARIRGLQGLIK